MDMLSPNFETRDVKLERRNSDPESSIGKRTISNASTCSRSGRGKRNPNRLITQEEKENRPRTSSNRQPSPSQVTSPTKERQNSLESSGVESDLGETIGSPVKEEEILKAQAFKKLRQELERAQLELRKRDEECFKLSKVRDNLEGEVEELTASLFQEAHNMVREANIKQASAEMKYKEAQMKLEGLQAEVSALKLLVITSTPANPGKKQHRRCPSADQICTDCGTCHSVTEETICNGDEAWAVVDTIDKREVDPLTFNDFLSWLQKRCPCDDHPFITRVLEQDIQPCLGFPNQELLDKVHDAIKCNTLIVESVPGGGKPRLCNLTKTTLPCPYKITLPEDNSFHFISQGCRARIVAVADFYTYIRYINQGLLKKEANTIYWDIMKKRADMALARLGLAKTKQ